MSGGSRKAPGALSSEVAGALRAQAARLQINDTQLAAAVGISQPQVSRYMKAKVAMNMEELYAICDALGLSPAAVVRDAEAAVDAAG